MTKSISSEIRILTLSLAIFIFGSLLGACTVVYLDNRHYFSLAGIVLCITVLGGAILLEAIAQNYEKQDDLEEREVHQANRRL